ncbi:replication initiator [Streptomyces populi]
MTPRPGRPLRGRPATAADSDSPDDDAVAAYVAKYVTKGASDSGAGTDYPLATEGDIASAPVNDHVRRLMRTCWNLGRLPEFEKA